ncbi:MAG: 50S ribosomal protein L29 [Pseudomonadota bacterium]|nr:50S ribosomal protein L29 [Pseudomonadota bacterium]
MKNADIQKMDAGKLKETLLNLRKEQMNLRFQKATGQMENPNRWREVRTTIARVKTQMTAASAAKGE